MSLAARLERLRVLVQDDLAALPDRPISPAFSDGQGPAGGVLLDQSLSDPFATPSQTHAPPEQAPPLDMHDGHVRTTNGSANVHENSERRFVWVQGKESSYNLCSNPLLSALPTLPLPPSGLQKTQLAPDHINYFTPIVALSKYPYKWCSRQLMQDIASGFFDQGKFWDREWDLFYLWDIERSKPLILIQESQVTDLLTEINSALRLQLVITNEEREEGLVSRFPDHPRCRPRYLGRCHHRGEYDNMIDQVPKPNLRAPGEPIPPPLHGQTLEDFKRLIEESWEAQKAKSKAMKEKKRIKRVAQRQTFTAQFKRAQRYLGLRPSSAGQNPSDLPPAVDCSLPAPFPFYRSVVIVCVDVEAYERDHQKITEVGIATLDTRDLVDVAPGKDGESWRSKIQARHFRIDEHAHLVNSDFVSGCPDRFHFGKSQFVSLEDAPAAVAACFRSPFCASPDEASAVAVENEEQRNIILLGHDTLGDVKYLQRLGFDPLLVPNLIESQDSANLYRVWHRDDQITRLGNILYNFDIPGFSLHNAGNDAVYTMQAFLSICAREASIRNSAEVKEMRDEQKESRIAFAQEEFRQSIEDDAKGWDAIEADGDGGEPVPIAMKSEVVTS